MTDFLACCPNLRTSLHSHPYHHRPHPSCRFVEKYLSTISSAQVSEVLLEIFWHKSDPGPPGSELSSWDSLAIILYNLAGQYRPRREGDKMLANYENKDLRGTWNFLWRFRERDFATSGLLATTSPRLFVTSLTERVGRTSRRVKVQDSFFFFLPRLEVVILRTSVLRSPSIFHAPSADMKEITDPFQSLKATASLDPDISSNFHPTHPRHRYLGHDHPSSVARGSQEFDYFRDIHRRQVLGLLQTRFETGTRRRAEGAVCQRKRREARATA